MMNLGDMFSTEQGRQAIAAMARQFGLSEAQVGQAVDALLPAFSVGMQNQARSVESFRQLIGSFGGGQHLAAFEYPQLASGSQMLSAGQDFMRQIFGGTENAAQQIQDQTIRQAAAVTGIGAQVLAKMLPVIASMILGGLFKGAMNNGLGGLLEQVMRGGAGRPSGAPGREGHEESGAEAGAGGASPAADPLGDLLSSIFGSSPPGQAGRAADPVSAGIDILKGMFETGRQVQEQQVRTAENIFDQVLKANKPS